MTGSTNTAVSWTVSPSGVGTLVNGTYTAPSSINAPQTIIITATSQADPTKSASATVNLVPVVGVSINPPSVSLGVGQQQGFVASVTGSTNTAVNWTVSPNVGTFVNGTYTAPSSINAPQTITITATSQADPTKSASATVNLVPVVGVSINPPSVSLGVGQQQGFVASVTGSTNTAVNWMVSPSGVGTLVNGTYTAPSSINAPQTITITATSQADPTKFASATVNLVPVVGVSVNPPSVSLGVGQQQGFVASVTGSTNTAVNWTVSPNVGTFVNGTYTAPSLTNAPQTITITATSQADPTKSASATVNLVPVVGVSINPPSVSLGVGQQQGFVAAVTGSTNTAVNWTVSPNNVGTFVNGTYTAPSSINAPQTIIITATSQADPTKSASATVNLVPVVGVSINPPTVSLGVGQQQGFVASVTGSTNTAVNWTVSPNVGTFVNGTYTAPSSINAPQTIIITATSQADPTKSASATVNLVPVVGVSINPPTVSLNVGQQQGFVASVTGLNEYGC